MKNVKIITNKDISEKENEKNNVIAVNYTQIFSALERLKKELETAKDDDVKRGCIMAQIALLNKKKSNFEKVYFNY